MHLAIGSEQDVLAREICNQKPSAVLCSESDLFEGRPMAFRKSGPDTHGFLTVGDSPVDLDELEGVVLRTPRTWWPSHEFSSADQVFVYHETVASWYALLSSLKCPVVNRFGLAWWVQDSSYPLHLLTKLAGLLKLPSVLDLQPNSYGRLWPTTNAGSPELRSVYVSGDLISEKSSEASELASVLAEHKAALEAWQAATGVYVCRIDFAPGLALRLAYVEAFPLLDQESPELVHDIAAAALEVGQ